MSKETFEMTLTFQADEGMTEKQAVKYIEHGAELKRALQGAIGLLETIGQAPCGQVIKETLAKLEVK